MEFMLIKTMSRGTCQSTIASNEIMIMTLKNAEILSTRLKSSFVKVILRGSFASLKSPHLALMAL